MSTDVVSSETQSIAPSPRHETVQTRWRFAKADHWAKATFRDASDYEVKAPRIQCNEPSSSDKAVDPHNVVIQVSPRRRKPLRSAVRRLLWCGVSAAFHLTVVIVFGVSWTPSSPPGDHIFITSENAHRSADALEELVIEPLPAMTMQSEVAVPTAFVGSGSPDAVSVNAPVLPAKREGSQARAKGPADDARSLAGLGGAAPSGETQAAEETPGTDNATAPGANFFGVQASGSRFVFVVDCSLSMQGAKWATACQELSDSINRLTEDQAFYVVFFDGEMHRMFDEKNYQKALLPANEDNLHKLSHWLQTVRLGYDTSPCLSVKYAVSLHPDAIFLLSDGEFSDPTAAFLRKNNYIRSPDGKRKPDIAVHTIGFKSTDGQKMLSRIAKENGGVYRFVP